MIPDRISGDRPKSAAEAAAARVHVSEEATRIQQAAATVGDLEAQHDGELVMPGT